MTTDANQEVEPSTASNTDAKDVSASSSDGLNEVVLDPEHFDPDSENIIPTVKDDIGGLDVTTGGPGEEKKSPVEPVKKEVGSEPETKSEKKVEKEEVPTDFHDHPAWQRIMKERDDARLEIKKLQEVAKPAVTELENDNKFGEKTDDELLEWMSEDPKGYSAYLVDIATKKAKAEMLAETQQKNVESQIDSTYDSYAEQNPANENKTGFVEMWESGDIQAYIDKHPGHNPISAHMELTNQARIDAAVAEAVAKTKEENKKQREARKITDGLTGGPGYVPANDDDSLTDTKRHGGKVTAIAARLAARRQQAV